MELDGGARRVTAGLAGNAVTNSLPGGSAAGAAVQFHMLTTAGFDTDTAVGGLTAFSLLEVGGLLALPVLALPAILAGVPVSRGLVHTALLGVAAFVLYAVFGVIVLRSDWPLATAGRVAQSVWNRVTRGHRPVTGLDQRLLAERDTIRAVLGKNWRQAVVLTAGRLGFDYGCLLAALRATGTGPQPSVVLLAYAAAGIIALFPVTPGGLGVVEASLSGLLILAGVRAGYAVLATLAYRIASYWLPLLAGPPAYLLFRRRYGRPVPRRATLPWSPAGGRPPEQHRAHQLAPAMHEPGPERNAGQFRRVVQERKPQPVGEYPVGGELITCHRARPGKIVVRRGPQRLVGGCQVPDLKAVADRDGGRAARRVGGEDDRAHRRDRPDLAEDACYALVK